MAGSITVILVLFVITTAFVKVNTDDYQDIFFEFTLTTVFIVNIFSSIFSGGLFGIAGMFSGEYISAVMSGQALGGVFTAMAEIVSLSFATLPTISAFIYFIVGTVMLVMSLVLYIVVSKTLFFKFHINQSHIKPTTNFSINADTSPLSSPALTATAHASVNRHYLQPEWHKIYSKIWVHGFSVFLVFVTTLSVYPAITVLIVSVDKGNHHKWNGERCCNHSFCLSLNVFSSSRHLLPSGAQLLAVQLGRLRWATAFRMDQTTV
jgi:solute carrier family 29 (equilibrative nucleoside transporter), member 1/2/3